MIEEGFYYANSTIKEMTDFFETRVENLEPKTERQKSFVASKKLKKNSSKKWKRKKADSNSSIIESSEESIQEQGSSRKYFILRGKCNHITDQYKNLHTLVSQHKKKPKFKSPQKSNK